MSHWDVIVVGSGAGGGTLVHRLAPSGKRILLLERGEYLPREKENWDVRAVQLDGRYDPNETWYDKRGARVQARRQVRGRRQHQGVGRGDPAHAARATSARCATRAGSRRPGRSRTRRSSPTTRRPSTCGACAASAARSRAKAPRAGRTATRRSGTRRACASSSRTSRARGVHASPLPLGLLLDDERPERDACIRCDTCDGFPCLVKGKADAQTICVEPALAHPNVTLLTGARVTRLETDATRAQRARGAGRARRPARDALGGRRGAGLRRDQLRGRAAALDLGAPSRRPRERLGPARPQLHVPPELGGVRAVAPRRTTRCCRRPSRSSTSTTGATTGSSRSA